MIVQSGSSMPSPLFDPAVAEAARQAAIEQADVDLAALALEANIPFEILRSLVEISKRYPADMSR